MIKDNQGLVPILLLLLILPVAFIILAAFFFKWLIVGIILLVVIFIIFGISMGKIKIASKSTLIVFIIVIALLFVAIGGGLLFGIVPINIDTNTQEINVNIEGVWGKGYGTYNGGSCYEPITEGEIFDKEAYAVAWKPGLESETINMQGCIFTAILWPMRLDDFKYKLYWSDNGITWELLPDGTYSKGADLRPNAVQYTFFGEYPNGAIRVEITADGWGGLFGDWKAFDDEVFAYDQAYIYQGSGDIEILNENKIVAVGEEVLIDVEMLGYSAGRGWTLELFSYPQNDDVKSWDLNDGDTGVYKYLVTSSDWVGWSGCDDPQSSTPNRLEARLYNNLWKQDEADADTIDLRANAPPQPIVTTDEAWYNVNDTVKITIEGKRNSGTNLELCYFLIDVYYQPGLIQIDDDTKVEAVNDNASYETDPLPQSGTIRVEVTAYDAGGHPSNHTIVQKSVKPYGQGGFFDDLTEGGLNWFWIIAIILIIVGVIALYYLTKKRRKR